MGPHKHRIIDCAGVTPISLEFRLSFRQIKCRCGADRVTGQPCPDCGARPAATEVDPERQRRQRIVRFARAELDANAIPFPTDLDETPELMKRVLERLLVAAGRAASPGALGDDLAEHLGDIARLRATVKQFRLRPEKGIATRFLVGVDEIEKAANAVLDALAAETPILAQRLQGSDLCSHRLMLRAAPRALRMNY